MLNMCYCLNGSLANVVIEEVGCYDECCPTGSRMAMNEHPLALISVNGHCLNNHQQFRYGWACEILPIKVVVSNTDVVEDFRVI